MTNASFYAPAPMTAASFCAPPPITEENKDEYRGFVGYDPIPRRPSLADWEESQLAMRAQVLPDESFDSLSPTLSLSLPRSRSPSLSPFFPLSLSPFPPLEDSGGQGHLSPLPHSEAPRCPPPFLAPSTVKEEGRKRTLGATSKKCKAVPRRARN